MIKKDFQKAIDYIIKRPKLTMIILVSIVLLPMFLQLFK